MDDEDVASPLVESVMAMLESGPMPVNEVVRRLDEHNLLQELRKVGVEWEDLGNAVLDEILDSDAVWTTSENVIARTDRLLDGLVLTHRVTVGELADDNVHLCPDLVIIDWNHHDEFALAGGGRLHRMPSLAPRPGFDDSTLSSPDGWLDGFANGDVVAFRLTEAGLSVELADALADDIAEVNALRASVESRLGDDEGEEAVPLILDALTSAPGTFRRPVRPLGELLEAAGLEQRGFSFGRRGYPWRSFADRFNDRRREQIVERYPFDACCVASFDRVCQAYEEFDETEPDVRAVGEALAHGGVAEAFAAFVLHDSVTGDERLVRFANQLLVGSQGRRRAGSQYLLGVEAERRGDAHEAEHWFEGALRDDPDDAGSALAQVDYAVDRGDLSRALRLLRHSGLVPDEGTIEFLEDARREFESPWRSVGRNDSCPCGSGRKFKACCIREPKIPLAARMRLLRLKLGQFASAEHRRSRLVSVAISACDPDDPNLIEQVRSLVGNMAIVDFALYDGGVAADYLNQRGSLLPADERELVEAVLASPRVLWEVTEVDRGRGLVLRDTATAETIHVVERTASREAQVGELVISRVARVSDEIHLWGSPLKVPVRLRESALALVEMHSDANQLASWYGDAIAFPRIMTSESEPLMLCHAELTTEIAQDDLATMFGEVFVEDSPNVWTETWELANGERISRGTVRVEDGRVLVDTMSEERLERFLDTLFELLPDADLVVNERRSARDAVREQHVNGDVFDQDPGDGPEDVARVLQGYLRRRELAWLDESIPALGGLTPREAVDDPTRREDLVSLLRELADMNVAGANGFDADRLRNLLGLT